MRGASGEALRMAKFSEKETRPFQKRDREATRLALIAAGEEVFAQRGFEGATYELIAEAAGVNKALIAYHFGSKEGLYDAVITALAGEAVRNVAEALDESGDAEANFRAYVRALAGAFWRRPSFPAIILREYLGGAMQERPAPFAAVLQFYRMTERLYEAGRKARIFRKLDPHSLHLAIVGPLIHFTIAADLRRRTLPKLAPGVSNPSIDEFAATLARTILDGVKRR